MDLLLEVKNLLNQIINKLKLKLDLSKQLINLWFIRSQYHYTIVSKHAYIGYIKAKKLCLIFKTNYIKEVFEK